MATIVRITFTGLCYYEAFDEGDGDQGVRVLLPRATGKFEHCNEHIDDEERPHPHEGCIITTDDHRGGLHEKKRFPIEGLELDLTAAEGDGDLAVPTHLASVRSLGRTSKTPVPVPERVLAEFRLRGGAFGVMCRKASNAVSAGWAQNALRWQDTWAGTIPEDELILKTSKEEIRLEPVGPMIDLTIVNLMHDDVEEWMEPDTKPLPTGTIGPANDFRWFYWMFGWDSPAECQQQRVPGPPENAQKGGEAMLGMPFTCVGGGG